MDIIGNLALGLEVALIPTNLLYCFIGVFLGMLVGVLPGIGVLSAIALLFPLTFTLDPTTALIMLAGIWYGTGYGGRTAAILLNIPGSAANAITCLDGYPMSQQGRAGIAMFMTTMASFAGGCFGIVVLMFFAPVIGNYALSFGSAEYFSLMLLGLVAACSISEGSAIKALSMVLVGILFGIIGADMYTGTPRFIFGHLELMDHVSIAALAMGVFGVSEIIASVGNVKANDAKVDVSFKAMKPTSDDVRRSWFPVLRGSLIGTFFGTLPGTGVSVASFMAYAVEKRIAKNPERFGKGAIEGIMAPESADNAAEQTSFVPTLGLGIPGSASMALMLGALMVHGIAPGPTLINEQPQLFWGLIMSFWIGNVILLVLNIPLIGLWVRMLSIPYHLLYPAVLVFVCIGAYSVNNSPFETLLVVFFGLLGYVLRVLGFPVAPMLLGFVLGPLMEEHLRRALLISRGDFITFVQRPISGAVLAITAAILLWMLWSSLRRSQLERQEKLQGA